MVRSLMQQVPGQHIGLQTDDAQALVRVARTSRKQPEFWSFVVGSWLDNNANH